jgi:alkylation response protein AidB-like acyl-CoA dehydrogenase
MDFVFTPQEEEWRQEVRAFCKESVTKEMRYDWWRTGHTINWEFHRKLADKGWIGLAWPQELGGQGRTHFEMAIFNEEMAYNEAPTGTLGLTVNLLGNSLRVFGTEDQQRRFLPMITSGELTTSELVTEPEAGSDAANVQTRAVADGDDYVITGTKIFNDGNLTTHSFATVRTDPNAPKHRGISLFIIDMNSDGVTNVPLWTLGHQRRNMLIMENVRVPRENLLGELNRGWYHIATLLDFERSNTGQVGQARRIWEQFVEYVKLRNLHQKRWVRETLATLAKDISVSRLMQYRVAAMQSKGKVPNVEASMAKIWGAETMNRFSELMITISGRYGLLRGRFGEEAYDHPRSDANERWATLEGFLVEWYGNVKIGTIGGGTNEIQRRIVALRGLGLPR